jgi:hypothetical protein
VWLHRTLLFASFSFLGLDPLQRQPYGGGLHRYQPLSKGTGLVDITNTQHLHRVIYKTTQSTWDKTELGSLGNVSSLTWQLSKHVYTYDDFYRPDRPNKANIQTSITRVCLHQISHYITYRWSYTDTKAFYISCDRYNREFSTHTAYSNIH